MPEGRSILTPELTSTCIRLQWNKAGEQGRQRVMSSTLGSTAGANKPGVFHPGSDTEAPNPEAIPHECHLEEKLIISNSSWVITLCFFS